ncbi:MAG: inorganic phosphate transporter [Actinomycetota bacterium]
MLDVSTAAWLQLGMLAALAFYVASNLGANDVANSMGTSVGSKALTLRQAIVVAGVLEFTGAVLFGQGVSKTLATQVVNPVVFAPQPQIFLIGMVAVLAAGGIWLQIATSRGLPVSSSHAVVGAIAGFSWMAAGVRAVDWHTIAMISLTWVATPILSGAVAASFYSILQRWVLDRPDPLRQMREWIPWLSSALFGVFGVIVLPTLSQPLQAAVSQQWGWEIPAHDFPLAIGAIAAITLTLVSWQQLGNGGAVENRSVFTERLLGQFQVLSACFVAFAHGSNDVGNAIAPLAAIAYIRQTGNLPLGDFQVPLWILILGGAGIVTGLALWGKNVISTVGEGIIELRPSSGFCAELATATTVLLASRLGLPVSTSHALVGAVVGVGLVREWKSVRFQTVRSIGSAWLITIPIAAGLGASIFTGLRLLTGF